MPIKSITTDPGPGHIVQVCAGCGAEHHISLDRGAQKTKTGPVVLRAGDTLELRVDGRAAEAVTFVAGDFANPARVTVAELAAKLGRALPGVMARDDAGGLLIESATTGPESRIEVTGGSAHAALGFSTDGATAPCSGRPVLGISAGSAPIQDPSVLALRRCNDCGASECLIRTFEATAAVLDGTHFKEHRRAVNTLAEHFKERGWSHPDLAAHHANEARRPLDRHAEVPGHWELAAVVRRTAATAAERPAEAAS
jgi:hypothetical protein